MKALNPSGMSKSTSSLPNPTEEIWGGKDPCSHRTKTSFHTEIRDVARQAYMVTSSRHCQLLDGMEFVHFPQWASGSAYIHVEPVQDERNFKLKKQVALIATLKKDLHSTT
jgi:hypothetical protein